MCILLLLPSIRGEFSSSMFSRVCSLRTLLHWLFFNNCIFNSTLPLLDSTWSSPVLKAFCSSTWHSYSLSFLIKQVPQKWYKHVCWDFTFQSLFHPFSPVSGSLIITLAWKSVDIFSLLFLDLYQAFGRFCLNMPLKRGGFPSISQSFVFLGFHSFCCVYNCNVSSEYRDGIISLALEPWFFSIWYTVLI